MLTIRLSTIKNWKEPNYPIRGLLNKLRVYSCNVVVCSHEKQCLYQSRGVARFSAVHVKWGHVSTSYSCCED